jgi:cell fate regulator YaaT (PSP1 superfamily)
MGCNSCGSHADGQPKGCKNNGTCGTDGCNKLSVFDWLSNMALPSGQVAYDFVEVQFKNSRKEFFKNTENLPLAMGDVVATQAKSGHDVGIVTLTGELVRIQMKKKKENPKPEEVRKVYRKASQKDIDIWQRCRGREAEIQKRSREIAISLGLEMKISDVEFQGDGSKATFYYTAEDRVDFRQLIKDMAKAFGIRIEMRQIGYRQEAQRLGGIGSCGRELCCATWLTDFRSVSTAAARYQQLSLNPLKLAGQCGKLKCCLNYELDTYLEALSDFPGQDTKLFTEKGMAFCQKVDIFKETLWFSYKDDPAHWHTLTKDQVNEIIALNKEKEKVASLEAYAADNIVETETFEKAVLEDSITRFDRPKTRNRNRKKKRGATQKVAQGGQKPAQKGNRKGGGGSKGGQKGGQQPKRNNPKAKGNNQKRGGRTNNNPPKKNNTRNNAK